MTRCPSQVDVGGYVLGVLEPDERERMRRHLGSCAACHADVDDLAALPTCLEAVPADEVLRARRAALPGGRPSRQRPDVVLAAAGSVHARAALTATRNGTRVVLTLGGAPACEQCRLLAVDGSGRRQTAGTWTATSAGDASVTGWLGMHPGDVDRLVIETLDGATLLTLASPHR